MDIPIQVWLGLVCLTLSSCLEVAIPERFLKPRDFNPHAYASQEDDLGPLDLNSLPHPYALFVRPPVHRGESSTAPIQFPKVPDAPTNKPETSATPASLRHKPQRLITDDLSHIVAKNYAFSYGSGDDYSHSQAHKGGATKGEYRVKLPDGRVQIVSYTADNSGYRADVRYDHDNSVEGYNSQAPEPIRRPHLVSHIKQYNRPEEPTYDELPEVGQVPQYLHNLETEDYQDIGVKQDPQYLSHREPVRYVVSGGGGKQVLYDGKQVVYDSKQVVYDKTGQGYVLERPRQDYTPIHEDYPDIPPPQRNASPEPPAPGPTQAYILSATPSPTPGYITPKPGLVYSLQSTAAPSPHKFFVLQHQVKPYQYS